MTSPVDLRATVIYYTSHLFKNILLFCLCTPLLHLLNCPISILLVATQTFPNSRYILIDNIWSTVCLRSAKWWHFSFASFSYSNLLLWPIFWPLTFPPPTLLPFPTLFRFPPLICVPLSNGGATFPWGRVAEWPTVYLSLTSSPLPAPTFSTHFPSIHSTFEHQQQMTQCPPALQPSSISHCESHTHEQWIPVWAPWDTRVQ